MNKIKNNGKNRIKTMKSPNYNYIFNLNNGNFLRWGKTKEDNPEYSEFGPEILDIEISSVCSNNCSFCYKSNTDKGDNMSFETFEKMFDKFPKNLTQIAFGIGDICANQDLWKIMDYCRINDVIPNITINGKNRIKEYYDNLKNVCGAVAVSLYDYDVCYDAVKELTDRGMKQINIHCLLSEETFDKCMQVLSNSRTDVRLKKLNAIVFLFLKPKGDRNSFHKLSSMNKFKELVDYAFKHNISIGFDSCSASNFLKSIKGHEKFKEIEEMIEPCESFGLFSGYINVKGRYFPCSFSEGEGEWKNGLDMVNCKDFMKDIWYSPLINKYRHLSLKCKDNQGCRKCLLFDLEIKQ